MDNLDVINKIKDDVRDFMIHKKILASFTISCALYYLNSVSEMDAKKLLYANNIMMRKASERYNEDVIYLDTIRGQRFKSYDSIRDCLEDWIVTFKSNRIKSTWDMDAIIRSLENPEYTKVNLIPYRDAYKLNLIDNEAFDVLYPASQSIVEVPVTETASKTAVYQQLSGYIPPEPPKKSVYKGPEIKEEHKKPRILSYIKGNKFTVNSANIYAKLDDNVPSRSFSGNVWLYDGTCRRNRYAIVINKSSIGKDSAFIDGYINKSDLK